MILRQLIDPKTSTYTYLLADSETLEAVIIDPVVEQVQRDWQLINQLGLTLTHVLDTHVHADHITAAGKLRDLTGAKTVFSKAAGVDCADLGVEDGDSIQFGMHKLEIRATPGHTNGCISFILNTNGNYLAFTGDALLIQGCGRTDFQQGDAKQLFDSVWQQIFSLPDDTIIYPGHDYRGFTSSTVAEEKAYNPRLGKNVSKQDFIEIMAALKLAYPKQIDIAVPSNKTCGQQEAGRS